MTPIFSAEMIKAARDDKILEGRVINPGKLVMLGDWYDAGSSTS